jgi:primary-amine oxidase
VARGERLPKERHGLSDRLCSELVEQRAAAAFADDYPLRRAGFARHHLWVTPYASDELFSAGDYPNQSRGGDGLPAWTSENRSIHETDIVLWYTLGFHHITAAEDWPVLPSHPKSVTLRPFNFFDRSQVINLAPAGQPQD